MCYQDEAIFNGYSRNKLPKIKDGLYLTNFDENDDNVTYFDSLGVEYITKEIKKFIGKKKQHNKYL